MWSNKFTRLVSRLRQQPLDGGGGGHKTALSDAPTVRQAIFYEFSGKYDEGDSFSGDVKYHLGMSIDRPTQSGKQVRHRAC